MVCFATGDTAVRPDCATIDRRPGPAMCLTVRLVSFHEPRQTSEVSPPCLNVGARFGSLLNAQQNVPSLLCSVASGRTLTATLRFMCMAQFWSARLCLGWFLHGFAEAASYAGNLGLRLDSPQATKNWGTIWENMLHVGHVPVDLSGTELSPRSRTMGHGAQQDCSSPLLLDHLLAHATR